MSLAAQARRLAAKAGEMRMSIFGVNADGERQKGQMCDDAGAPDGTAPFDCYYSPIRTQEQLDAVGFQDMHDGILRVSKTEDAFKPESGRVVRLIAAANGADLLVRLRERGIFPLNPEHVVGCKNL